jgi:hypothetical protein
MASFSTYPPSVLHPSSSKPLDIPSAHAILSTFLRLANLDPAYRPDSTLTERGPESSSSSGNPNLTLHHLSRIKLGLEGTNLGADDLDARFFGKGSDATENENYERKKRKWHDRDADLVPIMTGIPTVVSTAEEDVDAVLTAQDTDTQEALEGEGWQDRQDFELAQDDEDVDMNNAQRDPTAADTEEMAENIMEGETGRMINTHEALAAEDSTAETTRKAGLVHAQQEAEDMDALPLGTKHALSQREKDERKKRKRMRSKEEKITARKTKTREPAKTGINKSKLHDFPSPQKERKRKKKSHVGGEP